MILKSKALKIATLLTLYKYANKRRLRNRRLRSSYHRDLMMYYGGDTAKMNDEFEQLIRNQAGLNFVDKAALRREHKKHWTEDDREHRRQSD